MSFSWLLPLHLLLNSLLLNQFYPSRGPQGPLNIRVQRSILVLWASPPLRNRENRTKGQKCLLLPWQKLYIFIPSYCFIFVQVLYVFFFLSFTWINQLFFISKYPYQIASCTFFYWPACDYASDYNLRTSSYYFLEKQET